jgi:Rrf2 family nitric oxide-sensitive transcriptional repressor
MRLTMRTNLAMRTLMCCAVNDPGLLRSSDIAQRTNASTNHLLQVVNDLQNHGFVETVRGRTGGLRLARAAGDIRVGEVFRLFEGGTAFAECFDAATNTCPLHSTCRLRGVLSKAVEAFFQALDDVTLQDLVQGNCGLEALLAMQDRFGAPCRSQVQTLAA